MNCCIQTEKNYLVERIDDNPELAGKFRFLLGLVMIFVGLYAVVSGNFQGHGLGFFLVLASPLVILKDKRVLENSDKLKH